MVIQVHRVGARAIMCFAVICWTANILFFERPSVARADDRSSFVETAAAAQKKDNRVDIYGDPLPAGAISRLGTLRYRQPGWYKKGRFLRGSNLLAIGTSDNTLRFWNAETGTLDSEIGRPPRYGDVDSPFTDYFAAFNLTRDGECVVTVHRDFDNKIRKSYTQINLWNRRTGKTVGERITYSASMANDITAIAISDDGSTIAAGRRNGFVTFWDVASRREILHYKVIDRDEFKSIVFSPDSSQIAFAAGQKALIWDWMTGAEPKTLEGLKRTVVVEYSSDGKWLATGSDERNGIRLWDANTCERIWQIQEGEARYYPDGGMQFSSDDKYLAVPASHQGRRIDLVETTTGNIARTFDAKNIKMRVAAICDEQDFIAGVGSESLICVWRLSTGEPLHDRFTGHSESAYEVDFAHDGTTVVTSCMDGTARKWNLLTGEQEQVFRHSERWVVGAAISPNNTRLATIGFDDKILIWDLQTGERRQEFKGHGRNGGFAHYEIEFSRDGKTCYSFAQDLSLRHHDLVSGKTSFSKSLSPDGDKKPQQDDVFGDMEEAVNDIRFVPATDRLLFISKGKMFAFDATNGNELAQVPYKDNRAKMWPYHDGTKFITIRQKIDVRSNEENSYTYVAEIRSTKNLRLLSEYTFQDQLGWSHGVSRDGKLVAVTVYRPKTKESLLRIYDTQTWKLQFETPPQTGGISCVEFSPDARFLVSSNSGSAATVWRLDEIKVEKQR